MSVIKYLQLFVFGMIVITLLQNCTKESDKQYQQLNNSFVEQYDREKY